MMPALAFAVGTRRRERRPSRKGRGEGKGKRTSAGGPGRARAAGLALLSLLALSAAQGADGGAQAAGDPFVQDLKGAVVDWRRGKLSVHGAAAGDWRMPSAEIARAGAERRARSAGRARLTEALRALPLGGGRRLEAAAVERAVGRARTIGVEYQSNGGVDLQLEISFGDWRDGAATPSSTPARDAAASPATDAGDPSRPPALVLRLVEGPLAAAPVVVVKGKEVELGVARYAPTGELPEGTRPVAAKADKKGRLLVDGDAAVVEDLARRDAVIYVHKVVR